MAPPGVAVPPHKPPPYAMPAREHLATFDACRLRVGSLFQGHLPAVANAHIANVARRHSLPAMACRGCIADVDPRRRAPPPHALTFDALSSRGRPSVLEHLPCASTGWWRTPCPASRPVKREEDFRKVFRGVMHQEGSSRHRLGARP